MSSRNLDDRLSGVEETKEEKQPQDIEDGSLNAWLTVLGTHCIYISTW